MFHIYEFHHMVMFTIFMKTLKKELYGHFKYLKYLYFHWKYSQINPGIFQQVTFVTNADLLQCFINYKIV